MVKKIVIKLLELYRKYISPLKMPCCKYYPSCSQYAIDAVSRYGLAKGGILAVWRVLRCNPFSNGGFDPVR
jgi:putative membrane protein insertion efficiency factor